VPVYTIPCTPGGSAAWTQRTALDGVDFILSFDWNGRMSRWMFSLADAEGVAVVSGKALNVNTQLLRGVVDTRRPPGELAVIDTQQRDDTDPGFDDLGARFRLVYIDREGMGR
jgi:hypothetical protein